VQADLVHAAVFFGREAEHFDLVRQHLQNAHAAAPGG
jgi:hypothetical protein